MNSTDIARRQFLSRCTGVSLGAIALGMLKGTASVCADSSQSPAGTDGLPHYPPRARNVIFLTQSGGPSQIELFDYKPDLEKWAGKELPDSVRQGQRLTTMTSGQARFPVAPTISA